MDTFPYTELIKKLKEYLLNQQRTTEDTELKYELQFISDKLDEIASILIMMREFATMLKIFTKLPS